MALACPPKDSSLEPAGAFPGRKDTVRDAVCLYRMFLFMGLWENSVSALSAKQSGASEHWVYFKHKDSKLCK